MNVAATPLASEAIELNLEVGALLRHVAATAIMPRFRRLGDADVIEKTPGELVTVADHESEEMLTEGLKRIMPRARVIGEEACASDPHLLDGIEKGLVWIVDPLDGTANFAGGREPFGMIIALAHDGVTVGAWLYHPVRERMFYAALGGGAHVTDTFGPSRQIVAPAADSRPVAALATQFMPESMRTAVVEAAALSFELRPIPRCAAEHYPRLCSGENHIALFQRTLPWDHAAGALLLMEAGGHVTRWDGSPYRFHDSGLGILAASSRSDWEMAAESLLRDGQLATLGQPLVPPVSTPSGAR